MNDEIAYPHWKEEYKSVLKSLPGKKVLVLFSGGKDSSLTLDFILRAGEEFGFNSEAHAAAFPVHRYTDAEKERIVSYWSERGSDITWHDVGKTDDHIKEAANPCHPCQQVRKELLKTVLTSTIEEWERLVLVPSYSLWDIVSYSLEHLLGDIYSDSNKGMDGEKDKRFMETAQRFYPVLKMKEGYSVFRPLIKYNGSDIVKTIEQKGIPILSIPCEFSEFRPKRILERYYNRMEMRFEYDQVLDFARRSLNLPDISSYVSIEKEEYYGWLSVWSNDNGINWFGTWMVSTSLGLKK